MATAKTGAKTRTVARRRPWLTGLLLAILAAAVFAWLYGDTIRGYATAGTAFGAETACSCRYLGGRDLKSCKADFEPGMEAVFLSENKAERSVTAFVPLLSSDTARYREGFGCVLNPWED